MCTVFLTCTVAIEKLRIAQHSARLSAQNAVARLRTVVVLADSLHLRASSCPSELILVYPYRKLHFISTS
jgi:hypothetical protein